MLADPITGYEVYRSSDFSGQSAQIPCPLITHVHCYLGSTLPSFAFHAPPTMTWIVVLHCSAPLHHPSSFASQISKSRAWHLCFFSLCCFPITKSYQFYLQNIFEICAMSHHLCCHPSCPYYPNFSQISTVTFQLAYLHSLCPFARLFSPLKGEWYSLCSKNPVAPIAYWVKVKLLTLLIKPCLAGLTAFLSCNLSGLLLVPWICDCPSGLWPLAYALPSLLLLVNTNFEYLSSNFTS